MKSLVIIFAAAWLCLTSIGYTASSRWNWNAAHRWTWNGFYAGLNAGVVTSYDKIKLNPEGSWNTVTPSFQDFIANAGATTLSNWNFIGGGQVGYNYHFCHFLVGLEADGNYVNLSDHRRSIPKTFGTFVYTYRDRIEHHWLATARVRAGYVLHRLLPYLTGGFATGDVKASANITGTDGYRSFASGSKTLKGWTIGAGLEYAFKPSVSIKGEYLYVHLGQFKTNSTATAPGFAGFFEERKYHIRQDVARIGINFRL